MNETEEYLRNFDLGEEAKWAKKFSAQAASTLSLVKDFKCFLEPWEDPARKSIAERNTREVNFRLNTKYIGMCLFDEGDDDGDGDPYAEHRKIVSVEWVNRKGHQVMTVLVGSEVDADKRQGYMINTSLPPLIKAGYNPGWTMVDRA